MGQERGDGWRAAITHSRRFGKTFELITHTLTTSGDDTIVGVLGLIDLSLMAGLVVMVMFSGYENFVAKLDLAGHKDKPGWMGQVDFSDLKLKLMASIVAISAIHVLESFMNVEHLSDRELAWAWASTCPPLSRPCCWPLWTA